MNDYIKPKYQSLNQNQVTKELSDDSIACTKCSCHIPKNKLVDYMYVCPSCDHHIRVGAYVKINFIVDKGSLKELFNDVEPWDPLTFNGEGMKYQEKLKETQEKTNLKEAVVCVEATIGGTPVSIAAMDFNFMGGSMSTGVGEKIYRSIRHAHSKKIPLIIISCSGGARMHEGILSLMQMAKTSIALNLLKKEGIPFISILTDPTTGGVSASFASLGDVIIVEPDALIGFAGPRVIEQTIGQKLPEGFQKSNFVKEHGFVDMIVHRHDMKKELEKLIGFFNS